MIATNGVAITATSLIEGFFGAENLRFPPGTFGTGSLVFAGAQITYLEIQILLLALALVYLVMASLFESLAQPFSILFSIPFALPGAVWLLALTGTPFNLMAQIGLLILFGIVVNNGIVLLDHMNQLRRAGVPRDEAILQAGRDRLRAVLMTAATTILGLLPLAFGGATVGGVMTGAVAVMPEPHRRRLDPQFGPRVLESSQRNVLMDDSLVA